MLSLVRINAFAFPLGTVLQTSIEFYMEKVKMMYLEHYDLSLPEGASGKSKRAKFIGSVVHTYLCACEDFQSL